ncbi:MAG: aminotransferase class I/II-fold pyridoxal phosphate-dependent enzyme [Sphingobacterium sp.]
MTNLQNLKQFAGPRLFVDNREYSFFGGTAYLGLSDHPEYIENFKQGIDHFGLNNGTSRNNNVQLGIYQQSEELLANRFGFPSAALLSSGFLAGQVSVNALARDRKVYIAPGAHPAIWLSDRSGEQRSHRAWLQKTVDEINQQRDGDFLICANSLDNLKPELYDFSALRELRPDQRVTLLIDDSHGLGIVYKNKISFPKETLCSPNFELVVVASLAKGLGTDAGMVLANQHLIDEIKQHPIFVGSSPPSPAGVFALIRGASIYEKAFDKLHDNIRFFDDLSQQLGLESFSGFPVFTSKDPNLYEFLLGKNVIISSFPYPLKESSRLNRIVLSSLHGQEDLRHLSAILSTRIGL